MHLSAGLQYIVEEDGHSHRDPKSYTDRAYKRCIEVVIVGGTSGAAEMNTVDVPDDELEAWLDPYAHRNISRSPLSSMALVVLRLPCEAPPPDKFAGLVVRIEGNNERVVNTASMIASNHNLTRTCAVLRVLETQSMDAVLQRIDELRPFIWHPCILASLQIERRLK
ncbi:hypothetical protein BDV95DRAFT_605463 [Massariosphaeria phaeospora]|uniref:Uncharacterized protein n=1 Tax=Massariosphaeria phaeospora TaxID=100035 RepID=A0A7C8ICQ1_9PLEO|nr:hypothetical protein BDV95DRAFT_605463 [Massariosphaeria phaeospora]